MHLGCLFKHVLNLLSQFYCKKFNFIDKLMLCSYLVFIYIYIYFILRRYLINSIATDDEQGWVWAVGLFAGGLLGAFANQLHLHCMYTAGVRLRTTAVGLVFRHAIKLNLSAKIGVSDGELANMISTDSQKLYDAMPMLNLLWVAPFQIIVSVYFLIQYLGYIALADPEPFSKTASIALQRGEAHALDKAGPALHRGNRRELRDGASSHQPRAWHTRTVPEKKAAGPRSPRRLS